MRDTPEKESGTRLYQIGVNDVLTNALKNAGVLYGHLSGSTTASLFIANELLKVDPNSEEEIAIDEQKARMLSAVLAAEYFRSQFHTPEEVYLGLRVYLEKINLLQQQRTDKKDYEQHLKDVFDTYTTKPLEFVSEVILSTPQMMLEGLKAELAIDFGPFINDVMQKSSNGLRTYIGPSTTNIDQLYRPHYGTRRKAEK